MKLVSTEDLGLCYSTIIFYPLYLSIFTVSCILQEKKQIQLNFIDYILQLYLLQYKLQVTTEIHAFYVKTTFQTPDKFRVYMRTTGFVMFSSIVQNYLSDIALEIHKCIHRFSLIKNTLATFSPSILNIVRFLHIEMQYQLYSCLYDLQGIFLSLIKFFSLYV